MLTSSYTKQSQLQFRYLKLQDCQKGIFKLLSQLTKAPQVNKQDFQIHMNKMLLSNSNHVTMVAVDTQTNKIVVFGSIIICQTIRGRIGKIQNIVTCESVRGKGYGKVLIEVLKDEGWKNHCKKITLFCQNKNVKFYEKLGFRLQGQMFAAYS